MGLANRQGTQIYLARPDGRNQRLIEPRTNAPRPASCNQDTGKNIEKTWMCRMNRIWRAFILCILFLA
jgi:hypothetical protein